MTVSIQHAETISASGIDGPPAPGFADPVFQPQRLFRGLMTAMARPGQIVDFADDAPASSPLRPAEAAILLTLADADTTVWIDRPTDAIDRYLAFHTGCPRVSDPMMADFALITDPATVLPLDRFFTGEEAYPDRAATLILAVPSLTGGPALRAVGPGIPGSRRIDPKGLPAGFLAAWARNREAYPCGIDLFLAAGREILGLPRTTALVAIDPASVQGEV